VTYLILGSLVLASGGLAIVGTRGLLTLERRVSTLLATGVCLGWVSLLLLGPVPSWASDASIVLAGTSLGFLFGRLLPSSPSVLAFLTSAAVVDLVSFTGGLTRHMLEAFRDGSSDMLRSLAVMVVAGGQEWAVVGMSDLVILAAAYVGLRRATGDGSGPALWLLLGLMGGFLAGVAWGGAPGLPFLAASAWFYVFLHRRTARS